MRLHVGVIGAEELLDPVNRQALGNIHIFAAAVVALGWVALGIFVGQHRALGLQHSGAGVVFGRDQFDVLLLPSIWEEPLSRMMQEAMAAGLAVIGAGSWGTALAIQLARNGSNVTLWGHQDDEVAALLRDRENRRYLPGVPLPEGLKPTHDLAGGLGAVVLPGHQEP